MKVAASGEQGAINRRICILLCLLLTAYCLPACRLPTLESPECVDAREAVREFYSFHYANDIAMSPDNLKMREKYLTPELYRMLMANRPDKDYFTNSDTPLKAFKVAACKVVDPNKTDLGVHLFWKPNEQTTIQKEVDVEVIKTGDAWLINNVTNQK
jgi:hypothetical protein